MKALAMQHDVDPKAELLAKLPKTGTISAFHNQIVVAVYQRGEKTKSGIIVPNSVRDEDKHQGKVGLVIDIGPLAFKDDDRNKFGGQTVEFGEWVVFRTSDGFQMLVGDVLCRVLQDVDLKLKASGPDIIF